MLGLAVVHVGSTLADPDRHPPQEVYMFPLVMIIAMGVIAGFWVKTRRQRKARQTPYVPN